MDEIATIRKTKEIMNKYQISPKKNFGQNFLIDNNITKKIVANAKLDKSCVVIEIGPGIGGLTQLLAQQAKKVVAIEIDLRLQSVLAENLAEYPNIEFVFADFLKIDLEQLVENHFEKSDRIVVVANLPYYITTAILIKIFESKANISRIVAMMQKEVGERLSAKINTKEYNSLTILTQYYSNCKTIIKVPKSVFIPAPKVDSVVVDFEIIEKENQVVDEQLFFKVLRVLFEQRRKTILNNLSNYIGDKAKTLEYLNCLNLDFKLRAENLTLINIIDLSNFLAKEGYHG